jgi:predicted permease
VAEYVIEPQVSWRVLVFAMVVCAVSVVLIGLAPAIRVSRVDPNLLLKAGAGTGANRQNRRQYGIMVVAEIGLSLVLLSGAAIVLRTALHTRDVHLGYDLKPLTDTWVFQRFARDTTISNATFVNQTLSVARALPDVEDATLLQSRSMKHGAVTVLDSSGISTEIPTMANYTVVTPSYFRTFGLSIVQGRGFLDGIPSTPEVIVDRATARGLWPTSNPIGALIKLGDFKSDAPWVRVVGIAGSIDEDQIPFYSRRTPQSAKVSAIYYLPNSRDSLRFTSRGFDYQIVTRSKTDPERMPIVMGRTFRQLHPDAYVRSGAMEEQLGIRRARQSHDFVAAAFVVFAALAVSLAALGIYGIVAHSVAERKRELGVRIALGASGRNVVGLILREGNAIALAGVAVGLYLTKNTVKWLHAFSSDGDEYDVVLFASLALVLFLVALLAALIPALRATRVDPVESLRSE